MSLLEAEKPPLGEPCGLVVNEVSACPVNSHNEWDPLEEVVVGSLDGAMFPDWNTINLATVPPGAWLEIEKRVGGGGSPYPPAMVEAAQRDLEEFVQILASEGVNVRRVPGAPAAAAPYASPAWRVGNGFCAANPRDPFMVVGNEIIETPMADRNRFFEAWSYRELFKEYFRGGAKWVSAPKPQLLDALYNTPYRLPEPGEPMHYVVTEFEPVFDAADFVRCGRDLFCQKSNVTNQMGIDWLQRHLGDGYRLHVLENRSPEAIHIDTTFMPIAPGKVLVSPDYIDVAKLPPILADWAILVAPEPVPAINDPLLICSKWIAINVLMLDEKRIVVEKRQEPLIKALKGWGFEPIPCSFEAYFPFMGSFHCATLDVRRRGVLQSYF